MEVLSFFPILTARSLRSLAFRLGVWVAASFHLDLQELVIAYCLFAVVNACFGGAENASCGFLVLLTARWFSPDWLLVLLAAPLLCLLFVRARKRDLAVLMLILGIVGLQHLVFRAFLAFREGTLNALFVQWLSTLAILDLIGWVIIALRTRSSAHRFAIGTKVILLGALMVLGLLLPSELLQELAYAFVVAQLLVTFGFVRVSRRTKPQRDPIALLPGGYWLVLTAGWAFIASRTLV